MKLNKLVMSGLIVAGVVLSGTVFAKPGHGSVNMYRMLLSERVAEKLDLTAAQREQIKTIADAEKQLKKNFKKENKSQRGSVKALVQAETFDEQAFRTVFAAKQQKMLELAVAKAKNKNATWNLLTQEQQSKLLKMKEKKRKKMKQRHHNKG